MKREGFGYFYPEPKAAPKRPFKSKDMGDDVSDPYGLYEESYWDTVRKGRKPKGPEKPKDLGGRPRGSTDSKPRTRRTKKALMEARHGSNDSKRNHRGGEGSGRKKRGKHIPS